MTALLAPGLYRLPAQPAHAIGPLARGDVPVFLGYAPRGPIGVAVRVESLPMFESLFGPRPEIGMLWPAIKGFFENGGRAAYVLRLVDDDAQAAAVTFGQWTAQASFPWPMIDPRRLRGASQAAAAAWGQVIEAQIRDHGPRSADPGTWANALSLDIRRSDAATTVSIPDDSGLLDPFELRLASLAGIESGSILALQQVETTAGVRNVKRVHIIPATLDSARGILRLSRAVAALGLDASAEIRVSSVEFELEIRNNGRLEQRFDRLSPNPDHSRSLAAITGLQCRSVHLNAHGVSDWTDEASWPPQGSYALSGGEDGLRRIAVSHWLAAAPLIAGISEVALIAAPDLVLPDTSLVADDAPLPITQDCSNLSEPPAGLLSGRVTARDEDGPALASAVVTIKGGGAQTLTDSNGHFDFSGIEVGLVTVHISHDGYEPLEVVVQSSEHGTAELPFALKPRTVPAALSSDEVFQVVQALSNPAIVGPYRITIVDPVDDQQTLDQLRSWRSRLGDNMRIGLFGPWLRVRASVAGGGDALVSVPPCGHVCGAWAGAELQAGLAMSGANRALRFVEGLSLVISDAEQALINLYGINAIRAFPGRGIRINGARTLSADTQWRFLNARRIVDAIEKTLEHQLAWAVFEPNNLMTRHAITVATDAYLNRLWRAGQLAGDTPAAAYAVKCDSDNNPQDTQDAGQLILDIAVAPVEPYEFIQFRVGHAQDAIKVTE